jgi:uncharacterized protein YndB with AHSA1/START domain
MSPTIAENTDRIEKNVVLRSPRSRVWRALTNFEEFGTWFGVKLAGPFAPGARVLGKLTITGFDHLTTEMVVERVDPETLFSYRWHPYAIDPQVDYSNEPTTLVEFRLQEVAGGTHLTITESGFDRLPAARRSEAFRMNDGGWSAQIGNLERHVASR